MTILQRARAIANKDSQLITKQEQGDLHELCNWVAEAVVELALLSSYAPPHSKEKVAKLLGPFR